MSIEVQHVSKKFGDFVALDDVSFSVPPGELVALLGPSGGGKTTMLRIIAGLEAPDSGVVLLEGEDATERSARDRGVGFVFQHYALFRHMTVFENVAFGLRVRAKPVRPPVAEISRRVHDLLNLVQLDFLADRLPSQLSGGQRQRVALARALAVEPKVLLLDEPFGALDANVRRDLRRWLRRLHDEIHLTSVFVTHDQEEAIELADRVVIINRGIIEQNGSVDDVVDRPANEFVMRFFGTVNVFRDPMAGDAVVYARPHDVEISTLPTEGSLEARIDEMRVAGAVVHIVAFARDGNPIHIDVTREEYQRLDLEKGQRVHVRARQTRAFHAEISRGGVRQ
jgi:sulfate/thiosulfate transport system ATP-binding protein